MSSGLDTVTKQLTDSTIRKYAVNGLLPERDYTIAVRGYYQLLGLAGTTTVKLEGVAIIISLIECIQHVTYIWEIFLLLNIITKFHDVSLFGKNISRILLTLLTTCLQNTFAKRFSRNVRNCPVHNNLAT